MTLSLTLDFIGLILTVLGAIVLAISLSKYLTALHGAIAIHDITLKGILENDSKVLKAETMGNLLKLGVKNSALRTSIGLGLIVAGFIFQLFPFFICNTS